MIYAKEKGLEIFDLGGLWDFKETNKDPMKEGINTYKLSFGGEIIGLYT
jgi:hypothetical protein